MGKRIFSETSEKYKKLVQEEETDSEPEIEESQYILEDEPIEQEKEKEQKQFSSKRKNEVFEYLNKDTKKHKQ